MIGDRTWTLPDDLSLAESQRVRLRRFGLAATTYFVVALATAITTGLGLGVMTRGQWALYLGWGALNNIVFLIAFRSGINLRFADPSLTREQIVLSAAWGLVPLYAVPDARPILLMFYIPAFSFGMLRLTHRQYLRTVAWVIGFYACLLGFETSHHRPGFRLQYELFLFALFAVLLVWFATFGGFVSKMRQQLRERNRELRRAQIEGSRLVAELQEALQRVRTLSGLLPICTVCKKIRDDSGYWLQIELYIRKHSDAEFTHGICPECLETVYPEYAPKRERSDKG